MAIYDLLRGFIELILLIILLIYLKRNKNKSFIFKIITIISVICLGFLFSLPFENLFIKFDSIESIFNYTKVGIIVEQIENNHSCMVIYTNKNNAYNCCIFPKNNNQKYYIPAIWSISKPCEYFDGQNYFYINNITNTNDYYLVGNYYSDYESIKIFDNVDSDIIFQSSYNDIMKKYDYNYYAKIEWNSLENYSLTIDRKEYIPIQRQ